MMFSIRVYVLPLLLALGSNFQRVPSVLALASFVVFPALPQQRLPSGEQNASVEGIVTDAATGSALKDVVVTEVGPSKGVATTDARGHYSVAGLKPGIYASIAQKEGYPNTHIRRLRLMPSMKAEDINFQLHKGAVIAGRVTDFEGTPTPGATIEAWSRVYREGKPYLLFRGKANADEAGHYRMSGLAEGFYYLEANPKLLELQKLRPTDLHPGRAQNSAQARVFYPNVQLFDEATPIHIRTSEQRDGMDFVIDRVSTFCVIASVRTASGNRNPSSILVTVAEVARDWSHQVGGGSSNTGEKFEICGLIPGVSYVLTATSWQDQFHLASFARREFVATRRDADMGFLDIGALSLQEGRPVVGKVIIPDRQPEQPFPSGLRAIVEPSRRTPFMNETRDVQVDESSGDFLLSNVIPDEHSLRILGLPFGYYVKEITFDQHELRQGAFTPGEGELRVVLASDGATLEGQVITKDNQLVSDAKIILVPKSARDSNPGAHVMATQVDQNGGFQFASGVVPGDYRVVAVAGLLDDEAENPNAVSAYFSNGADISLTSRGHRSVLLTVVNTN